MKGYLALALGALLLSLPAGCGGMGLERSKTGPIAGQARAADPTPTEVTPLPPSTPAPPASPPAPSPTTADAAKETALIYLQGQVVYRLDSAGQQRLGSLPEGAGHLALGPRSLAYASGGQIRTLSLADGTVRPVLDLGERPGQSLDLHWSNDGLTLAYAMAWDEPGGARKVELGITNGREQRTLDAMVARPAGPTPTPPAEPPLPPEPGFANLAILDFDRQGERLAVTPAGGQERYSAVWLYHVRSGKLLYTMPLPAGIGELAMSPDLAHLAYTQAPVAYTRLEPSITEARCVIYDLAQQAEQASIVLPAGTHAACLRWSPSGEALALLKRDGAGPGLAITDSLGLYLLYLTRRETRELPFAASPEAQIHGWTADGKALVVEVLGRSGLERTWQRVDVRTGQTESIALPAGARVLGLAQ